MATAVATTGNKAIKRDVPFSWAGMDKKGNRVSGKSLAPDEASLRADLRRQGIAVNRIKKQSQAFKSGGKVKRRRHRRVQPPARDHARRRYSARAVLRNRRQRQRQAGDAEAHSRHQGGRRRRHLAARSVGQASAAFRRPVREPRRGRRTGRCARNAARQDRDIQGKDRGPQEEGQEGPVLSDRGHGRGHHRHGHPAAVRDSAVRGAVQGLRRGPAGVHPVRHQHVALAAGQLVHLVRRHRRLAFYAFFYFQKRSRAMREWLDRATLKLPIIGPILYKSAIARFARTLSTMFAAGVPLVEALESVAGATGNIVFENAVLKMRDEVATGQRLQRAMENTGLFPNMVIQMIAVGEEAGALDAMSGKVATFYEAEVDNAVDSMSSLLEPLIMADPRRARRRPGHRDVPPDLQTGRRGLNGVASQQPPKRRAHPAAFLFERQRHHGVFRHTGRQPGAVHRRLRRARPDDRQLPQRGHPSRAGDDGQRAARRMRGARPEGGAAAPPPYNLVTPRSACPKCQAPITALQNIPVVSWLALRGKCANCKTPISKRYPLVELATGLLSAFIAWRFGYGTTALAALAFTWFLIALTMIDFDTQYLPDQLTYPLLWLGLIVSLWHPVWAEGAAAVGPRDSIIGAAAGYLSLWSVYWLFKLAHRQGRHGLRRLQAVRRARRVAGLADAAAHHRVRLGRRRGVRRRGDDPATSRQGHRRSRSGRFSPSRAGSRSSSATRWSSATSACSRAVERWRAASESA